MGQPGKIPGDIGHNYELDKESRRPKEWQHKEPTLQADMSIQSPRPVMWCTICGMSFTGSPAHSEIVYRIAALVRRRDVPDIHPVPGKCRVSHYSVFPGPGKIMGPSNKKKKKIFFLIFFTRGINDPLGRQKLC